MSSPGKLNDHPDIFAREDCACRVPGIDDNNTNGVDSLPPRLFVAVNQNLLAELPAVLLIEIVSDLLSAVQRKARAVERILRHRDHEPVVRAAQQCHKDRLCPFAGPIRQYNVFPVRGYPIAFANEIGDCLPDERDPRALRVGARPMRMKPEDFPGSPDEILGVPGANLGMIQKVWIFHEAQDLAQVGERLLLQRLRVSDVTIDDFPPLFLQLLRADNDGSTDGILGCQQVRVKRLPGQHVHSCRIGTAGVFPTRGHAGRTTTVEKFFRWKRSLATFCIDSGVTASIFRRTLSRGM